MRPLRTPAHVVREGSVIRRGFGGPCSRRMHEPAHCPASAAGIQSWMPGVASHRARLIGATTAEPLPEALPGSAGEHKLQERYDTAPRAAAFYRNQVLDYLNPQMQAFIAQQEMMFVGTADGHGEADVSFRAGLPGFVRILDEKTLAYPEYRGNGVMASLGNISENPHVGLLFVHFAGDRIGLHVNGRARIVQNEEMSAAHSMPEDIQTGSATAAGRRPERWVVVSVAEAYIHCSKHIPHMKKIEEEIQWGTDDIRAKGGDYFKAKDSPRRSRNGIHSHPPASPETPAASASTGRKSD